MGRVDLCFDGEVYKGVERSLRALVITETELRLMATPASMGLSSRPKKG
jgi:hypothetical protein